MYVVAGDVNLAVSIVKLLHLNIVTSKFSEPFWVDPIVAVKVTVKVPISFGSLVVAIAIVFVKLSRVIRVDTGKIVIV